MTENVISKAGQEHNLQHKSSICKLYKIKMRSAVSQGMLIME